MCVPAELPRAPSRAAWRIATDCLGQQVRRKLSCLECFLDPRKEAFKLEPAHLPYSASYSGASSRKEINSMHTQDLDLMSDVRS